MWHLKESSCGWLYQPFMLWQSTEVWEDKMCSREHESSCRKFWITLKPFIASFALLTRSKGFVWILDSTQSHTEKVHLRSSLKREEKKCKWKGISRGHRKECGLWNYISCSLRENLHCPHSPSLCNYACMRGMRDSSWCFLPSSLLPETLTKLPSESFVLRPFN